MKSLTDRIYGELVVALKEGKQFESIYEKYKRSKGPLYNALSRALFYAKKRMAELASKVREDQEKVAKIKEDLKGVNEEVGKLRKLVEGLRSERVSLEKGIGSLKAERDEIKGELQAVARLRNLGYDLDTLVSLATSSEKYGGVKEVLTAIAEYGRIRDLQSEAETVDAELEEKKNELQSVVKEVEEKRVMLDACSRIAKMGFDEGSLKTVADMTKKYGGIKRFLERMDAYKSVAEMEVRLSDLQSEEKDVRTRIDKLNVEHAGLSTAIKLCQDLLYEYKVGFGGIEALHRTIGRFGGNFVDVLRAVESYGEIEKLEQKKRDVLGDIQELKKRCDALKTDVRAEEQRLKALQARYVKLHSDALEAGKTIGRVEQKIENYGPLRTFIELSKDPIGVDIKRALPLASMFLRDFVTWSSANEGKLRYGFSVKSKAEDLLKAIMDELK